MCFTHDCDWYAEVIERTVSPAIRPIGCQECGRQIQTGSPVHNVWMQENEYCAVCGGYDNAPCPDGECDYGNEEDFSYCDDCAKFLLAVKKAEEDAGCKGDETQPNLGELLEEISNCRQESKRYFKVARVMFPELVSNGYLKWLWRTCCGME